VIEEVDRPAVQTAPLRSAAFDPFFKPQSNSIRELARTSPCGPRAATAFPGPPSRSAGVRPSPRGGSWAPPERRNEVIIASSVPPSFGKSRLHRGSP
jgi:hypothetical protein